MVTRAFGALAAAAAMTATALPAHAVERSVSVTDRLGQIAQVEDAVPVADSPLAAVRKGGEVRLGTGAGAVSLHLPSEGRAKVSKVDGRYVVPASDGASLAVAPLVGGTQILVGVESAAAPTRYDFALDAPAGFTPRILPDGSAEVANARGEVAARVEAPWAVDARGRRVPTRFELSGGSLTQIVDHHAADFAYPVVADPKVKFCDLRTAACVKFSKKETRKARDAMFASVGAGVGAVCGKIPTSNAAGLAARAVCAGTVTAYFYRLRGVFSKAKKQGKCVELKFRVVAVAVPGAKVVKC